MKLLHFFLPVLALFTLSVAQSNDTLSSLADVPACAQLCGFMALANSYCVNVPLDRMSECTCNNPEMGAETTKCVVEKCTVKESLAALRFSKLSCGEQPRDDRHVYYFVTIFFAVMSSALVVARLVYKVVTFGWLELGLDDLFISLTIITGVIPSAIITTHGALPNGLGVDIWAVPVDNIYTFLKFHFVVSIIYFLQVGLLKMSLLFFYMRIFPAKEIQRVLWGTVAFNAAITINFVLMNALQCAPNPQLFWTAWDGEPQHQGSCNLSFTDVSLGSAAFSIAIDVWMLAVPMWELRKLQLHWTKKLGVAIMFATGTFFTVLSCIRLRILADVTRTLENVTYDQLEISIWSCVEITVGIICACMPTMRLLIVRVFPSLSGSTARSYAVNSRSDAAKSAYARASSRRQSHVLGSVNGGHDADDLSGPPPFPLRTLTSGTTIGHVRSMSPTSSIPPGAIRMEKDYSVVSTPQVPPVVAVGRSSLPTDSDDDQTRLVIMGNNDLSKSASVRSSTNANRK
ncbi:hypothetical protein MCOR27_006845 [Pyricularia oryzae]|uniref:CFEM domain-containing protein n=2 Tax=Pyricularia TaxID=48558 RepID=A0ABQ8NTV2_PYRGI|nr:hypothetical protein MCOR01_009426 [Pyricularia oryzae]KAI6301537.1 hypothetical protein MCOR33_002930 [Pyricularia grisea]KAH9437309.1 hypothetical protein MCOR02_000964 [Pyricularia oryzae]KAI6275722.1 hypothetical protein MCOR27_006845 [Pyricularia oryzae]KAI6279306.1 hypothetical protein MCOR26_004263 [Pyricularia oryzae]